MSTRAFPKILIILLCAAAFSSFAFAAVTCSMSSAGVAFGTYPIGPSALDSSGTLAVTCAIAFPPLVQTVNYTLTLSAGGSGSLLARQMDSAANKLNYNIYTTNARTQVWGDTSGSTANVTGLMTIGFIFWPPTATNNHTLYGRVPAAQDVAAGIYGDTIIATVTY